jgi:tryptophan-rich hypothetical protein
MFMNLQPNTPINPEKLLLSKWTAVQPRNKENHFIVTRLIRNEQEETVVECILEATSVRFKNRINPIVYQFQDHRFCIG